MFINISCTQTLRKFSDRAVESPQLWQVVYHLSLGPGQGDINTERAFEMCCFGTVVDQITGHARCTL